RAGQRPLWRAPDRVLQGADRMNDRDWEPADGSDLSASDVVRARLKRGSTWLEAIITEHPRENGTVVVALDGSGQGVALHLSQWEFERPSRPAPTTPGFYTVCPENDIWHSLYRLDRSGNWYTDRSNT